MYKRQVCCSDPDFFKQRFPTSNGVPPVGCLFKASWQREDDLRAEVRCPKHVLIQTAEKGSYKTYNVVDFLRWVLPTAEEAGQPAVLLLDWYAAHLSDATTAAIEAKGHFKVMLGGCLTSGVQVNDTHVHGPFNRIYRSTELRDNAKQASIRPHRLPDTDTQTVVTRSYQVWSAVKHHETPKAFEHNGITNPLDGDDFCLGDRCAQWWQELEMPTRRAALIADVEDDAGIAALSQLPDLLEPYEDHPYVLPEMKYSCTKFADKEAAALDDVDSEQPDEDGEDAVDSEDDTFAGAGAESSELSATATSMATSTDAKALSQPPPVTAEGGPSAEGLLESRARAELEATCDGKQLVAARQCLEICKRAEFHRAVAYHESEIRLMLKRRVRPQLSKDVATHLRVTTFEARSQLLADQQAAREMDLKLATLAKEIKLKTLSVAEKKAATSQQQAANRAELVALKKKKDDLAASATKAKEATHRLRETAASAVFAAQRRAMKCTTWEHGAMVAKLRDVADVTAHSKTPKRRKITVPVFWTDSSHTGRVELGAPPVGAKGKALSQRARYWVSPAFRDVLVSTAPTAGHMKALDLIQHHMKALLPGYNALLGATWPLQDVLQASNNDVDYTWLHMTWRYSQCMPAGTYDGALLQWPPPEAASTITGGSQPAGSGAASSSTPGSSAAAAGSGTSAVSSAAGS